MSIMMIRAALISLALSFSVLQLSEPNAVVFLSSQQEVTVPASVCFTDAGSYTVGLSIRCNEFPSATTSFLSIQAQTSTQKRVVRLSKNPQGETEAKVALRDGSQLSVSVKAVVRNTWEQIVLTASYLGADSVLTLCSVSEITQCSYVTSQIQFESLDSSLNIINLGNAEVKLLAEITNMKIIPQALTSEEISQLSKSQILPGSNAAISAFNPTCDAVSLTADALPINVRGSEDRHFIFKGATFQSYQLIIGSRAYTGIVVIMRPIASPVILSMQTIMGDDTFDIFSKPAPHSQSIVLSKRDWPFNADVDGLKREFGIYCSKEKSAPREFILHVLLFTSNSWYANGLIESDISMSEESISLNMHSRPIEIRNGVMVYPGSLANGMADTYALVITDLKYSGVILDLEVHYGSVDLSVTVTINNRKIRYDSMKDEKHKNITISKNDQNFKGEKSALQGNFTIHCEAGSDIENVYLLTVTLYESNPWEVATSSTKEIGSIPNSEAVEASESSQLVTLSIFAIGIVIAGFALIQQKRRQEWRSELEVRLTQDA